MQVQKAILTALLAAAGLAVFADDAQALGRRRKAAASNCGGCGGGYSGGYSSGYSSGYGGGYGGGAVAPAPCGGCGSGYATTMGSEGYVGSAGLPVQMVGNQGGNVIVSGETVPNYLPGTTGTTNLTTIPATSFPTTNVFPATTYPAGTVMPATQFGGYQGGVIQSSGYSPYYGGNVYGNNGYGYSYGSQTYNGGFQNGVMSGALGVPQYNSPGTTISGAVGNYAGNAVSRGLFRRR